MTIALRYWRTGLLLAGAALGLLASPATAQQAADYEADTFVPPPAVVHERGVPKAADARIIVTYDNDFPPQARAAFDFATGLWEEFIASPVPIQVTVRWDELDERTLGAASPTCFYYDDPAFPVDDALYAVALAEALYGESINDGSQGCADGVDISATFNSAFDYNEDGVLDWYFGTDGQTPAGTYDFVTVVLHELGHGLGFVGSFEVMPEEAGPGSCPEGTPIGWGCWGLGDPPLPLAFDRFVEDANEVALLNEAVYPNPSPELGAVLQSDAVFFEGPGVERVTGEFPIDLYAPSSFDPGSSFSHLNEVRCLERDAGGACIRACITDEGRCARTDDVNPSLADGGENSLMTPQLARGEAIFTPGPFTCAIFAAQGWPLGPGCQALLAPLATLAATPTDGNVRIAFTLSSEAVTEAEVVQVVLEQETAGGSFAPVAGVAPLPVNPDAGTYEVLLEDLREGSYTFRLRLVRATGSVTYSEPATANVVRDRYAVAAYPSPFTDLLRVEVFAAASAPSQRVRVTLHDVLGREVAELLDGRVGGTVGGLEVVFEPAGLPGGLYFVHAAGDAFARTQKVIYVAP